MSSTCNHSIFYTRQLVFVHLFNCSKRIKYLTRFATAKNIICNSYLFCVVRVRGCCWLRFFCAIFSSSADRFSSGCCWFFIYPHFCLPFYASEMALFIPFFSSHFVFAHDNHKWTPLTMLYYRAASSFLLYFDGSIDWNLKLGYFDR